LECGFPGWLDLTQPPIFRIPKPFLIEFITASRAGEFVAEDLGPLSPNPPQVTAGELVVYKGR
jgi:hypothetical protein